MIEWSAFYGAILDTFAVVVLVGTLTLAARAAFGGPQATDVLGGWDKQ